jgi:DNA-binding Lrp family transcriptional regulator
MFEKPSLDRTDFEILELLQADARLSNKELAQQVHLAPSSCLERVRKLRDCGVLLGAHAEVNPAAFGVGIQAFIEVRLAKHSRDDVDNFRDHVLSQPEVQGLWHVSGQHDFLVQVAVRDSGHLRDLAMDQFTSRSEVVNLETSLIFDYSRTPGFRGPNKG